MGTFSSTRAFAAGAMLTACLAAGAAQAQVTPTEEAALRIEQREQFAAMFEAPDDVDLMFQYAVTSIRLQDFEAAITTLERILIYNPNLPRVKVELGASYFRIGSYPVAKFYFEEVINDDTARPELKERVQEFLDEINKRTRTSYFTGRVGIDTVFTTNANFGPEDRNALFLGGPIVLTAPDATSQTDAGFAFVGQVSHVYDLASANGDVWRSDLAFSATRFADTSDGATDVVVFRSGPRLSLDDDRYGPKIRPYVELSHVRFAKDPLQTTIGGGFELTNTLNQSMSLFSDLRIAYRDSHINTNAVDLSGDTIDQDGLSIRANAGVNYFYDRNISLRGFVLAEFTGAETKQEQSYEFGFGGIGTYRYDSGLEIAGRDWLASAGFRAVYRRFDEDNIAAGIIDGRTREDLDLRLHIGHTAFLQDDLSLTARAEYFVRESNIKNFDLQNFTAKVGIRYSF